jgi:predicted DNA binding CopG/RHH family protein
MFYPLINHFILTRCNHSNRYKEIKNMIKESEKFEYQDISDRLKQKKIKSYEEIDTAFQIIERSN